MFSLPLPLSFSPPSLPPLPPSRFLPLLPPFLPLPPSPLSLPPASSLCSPPFLPLPLSPLSLHSELEWMLSEKGVLKTDLEENPRKKHQIRDVMSAAVKSGYVDPEDSDDDSD